MEKVYYKGSLGNIKHEPEKCKIHEEYKFILDGLSYDDKRKITEFAESMSKNIIVKYRKYEKDVTEIIDNALKLTPINIFIKILYTNYINLP